MTAIPVIPKGAWTIAAGVSGRHRDRAVVAALVLLGALSPACQREPLPSPRPSAVVPPVGWNGSEHSVEIRGSAFAAEVVRKLEGEPFSTSTAFRAWLGSNELSDVRFVDSETLTAVVPMGFPAGVWDLTIESPSGTVGSLEDAYRAFTEIPARLTAKIEAEPLTARVGETITITLSVSNDGETSARDVAPQALDVSGEGATSPGAGPASSGITVAGGSTEQLVWTRRATAAGPIQFTARVAGHEAFTGEPLIAETGPSVPVIVVECLQHADCNDGLFCTGVESCSDGRCQAGPAPCADDAFSCTTTCDEVSLSCNVVDAGSCLIASACFGAGEPDPSSPCRECDPQVSQTSWTIDDTNLCDDGIFCNGAEACSAGACERGPEPCGDDGLACTTTCDEAAAACNVIEPGFCAIAGACYAAGTLKPGSSCSECTPAVSRTAWSNDDTNACDDGDACTSGDACTGGVCFGTFQCDATTPPIARFSISPRSGTPTTGFFVDASETSDLEDPLGALEFRWDWESDGTWDTAFSSDPTASHVYGALPPDGSFTVTLEARDRGLRSARVTKRVPLVDEAHRVVVTTALDESDSAATPAAPGGTGLSLREALSYIDNTVPEIVTFAGPMTIVLGSPLPGLKDGDALVGEAGVAVDGAGLTDCLQIKQTGTRLIAMEIFGCTGSAVWLEGFDPLVEDCHLHDNGIGVKDSAERARIGPGNEITGSLKHGIEVSARSATIEGNWIHGNDGTGIWIALQGSGTVVRQNFLQGNGAGAIVGWGRLDDVSIVHNTVHDNGGDGILLPDFGDRIEVRANLLTNNLGAGLSIGSAGLAAFDSNDYFGNLGGSCLGSSCEFQTTAYSVDPSYVDEIDGDLRLLPGSPVVDLCIDMGLDLNGTAPGLFFGSAPDLGAWEAPAGY